jgi:hypothetical protein
MERPVRQSFLDFFSSSEQLNEAIGQKLASEQMRQLVAAARQISKRIQKAPAAARREELTGVLDKVTLGTGRIRV